MALLSKEYGRRSKRLKAELFEEYYFKSRCLFFEFRNVPASVMTIEKLTNLALR